MANLFKNAKVASKPAKAAKKTDKAEVEIDGIASLAAVDALLKSLTAIKETLDAEVKAQMLVEFKRQVAETKTYESFRGTDDGASASCEFRKRSTASALTASEIDELNKFNVPFGQNVLVESCYRINPKYTGDSKLLEQISNAIGKVKGVPEDFIELQEGASKAVVTEDTIRVACNTPGAFDKLASVIGVMAVKPKLDETDPAKLLEIVGELIA